MWVKSSKEAKDLVNNLIVKKPEDRLTIRGALNHKWFKTEIKNICVKNKSLI